MGVYAQVPERDGGRVDLVALNPETKFALLVEGKRLFNTGKASSMAADLDRMNSLRLVDEYGYLSSGFTSAALLLATTWSGEIAAWWTDMERGSRPARCRQDYGWAGLGLGLRACDRVGGVRIWGPDSEYRQTLLYALKRRG